MVYDNFLRIAYVFLKEIKHLIYFCYKEKNLDEEVYNKLVKMLMSYK